MVSVIGMANTEVDSQEFVVERFVRHKTDDGVLHNFIRWYGYPPEKDKWEPIEHLPISKIIFHHRKTRFALQSTLDNAQVG